jgi:hypothetical protein
MTEQAKMPEQDKTRPTAGQADAPPMVDLSTRPMPYGREATPEEFKEFLILLHDEKGLWRICAKKSCKRARRCRGDLGDCIRCFPATAMWQMQLIDSLRAGVPDDQAISEANLVGYGLTE